MTTTKKLWTASACLALSLLALDASAACDYPKKAPLPDGRNATEQQMLDGQKAVKAYMAAMDEYLACLDKESDAAKANLEDEDAIAQRDKITVQRHNAAVDEMKLHVAEFNDQIRAFKDRD